jgi:hypothetical protein
MVFFKTMNSNKYKIKTFHIEGFYNKLITSRYLNIKSEMHHIAVLNNVLLSFNS